MEFEGFDWDTGNRDKCQSHGVTIDEIESLFCGFISLVPDPRHSTVEERLKAIGRTPKGRAILVVFTTRRHGKGLLIRPVSARYMHRKEAAWYEKTSNANE